LEETAARAGEKIYIILILTKKDRIFSIPLIAVLGNVVETSVDIIEFNLTDYVGNNIDYNFE
jgi:hypothetical protein